MALRHLCGHSPPLRSFLLPLVLRVQPLLNHLHLGLLNFNHSLLDLCLCGFVPSLGIAVLLLQSVQSLGLHGHVAACLYAHGGKRSLLHYLVVSILKSSCLESRNLLDFLLDFLLLGLSPARPSTRLLLVLADATLLLSHILLNLLGKFVPLVHGVKQSLRATLPQSLCLLRREIPLKLHQCLCFAINLNVLGLHRNVAVPSKEF